MGLARRGLLQGGPAEYAALIAKENAKRAEIVKVSGATVE